VLQYDYPNNFTRNIKTLDTRAIVFGSSILVDSPDFNKFPLYRQATAYRVVLNPGDVLYLPAYWHHEVQSLPDEDVGLNIAVNFWYANLTHPVDDAAVLGLKAA
jgi:jumonji domain-containing protein 7